MPVRLTICPSVLAKSEKNLFLDLTAAPSTRFTEIVFDLESCHHYYDFYSTIPTPKVFSPQPLTTTEAQKSSRFLSASLKF